MTQCIEFVTPRNMSMGYTAGTERFTYGMTRQCSRQAVDGNYCKQHAAARARLAVKMAQRREYMARKAARAARK